MTTLRWNPFATVDDPQELARRTNFEHGMLKNVRDLHHGALSMEIMDRVVRDEYEYVPRVTPLNNTTCRGYDLGLDMVVPGWDTYAVYIDRDWSSKGLLCAPYRVCIHEFGRRRHFYRVRTVQQFRSVLHNWYEFQSGLDGAGRMHV